MPKDKLGTLGENLAVDYLVRRDYRILERNFRNRIGELDIVASKGGMLCFVEVKTRTSEEYGDPLEAITPAKQRKLVLMAQSYLNARDLDDIQVRFDVMAVDFKNSTDYTIEFFENAFDV